MDKEFKTFQKILVKQGEWIGAFFSHERSDGFIITTGGGVYTRVHVLPYEGNEDLLGTDKDPKPKRWRAKREEHYWFIDLMLYPIEATEKNISFDDDMYEIGNYFKSKYEAEVIAEKLKKTLSEG